MSPKSYRLLDKILGRVPKTRGIFDLEWDMYLHPEDDGFIIKFYVERTPARFKIQLTEAPRDLVAVEYGSEENPASIDFETSSEKDDDGNHLVLCDPTEHIATDRVVLRFGKLPPKVSWRINIELLQLPERDFQIVNAASDLAAERRFREAIDQLLEYTDKYSDENPTIWEWLARWHQSLEELEVAAVHAARAAGLGSEEAASLYRQIVESRPPSDGEEFKELQKKAAEWSIGPQHGVVVLERSARHLLGLGKLELRTHREVIEVRRAAAARMLSRLFFSYSSRREYLLHTSLTVHRPDGGRESVPLERFTVGDHHSNNIFITVEDEREGNWILPDLAPGDIIEWTYDLIHRKGLTDGTLQTFLMSSPFHSQFVTFSTRYEYVAPDDMPIRFVVRNGELETSRKTVGSQIVHQFSGGEFIPAKQTGFSDENSWLNPLIVCSGEGLDWAAVGRHVDEIDFGSDPIEEDVPAPLSEIIDGVPELEALERAFYWMRDKLRYASVQSGVQRIGAADRGRQIVEAGVGDCKDKSYLLALVCRKLDIKYEFVYISSKNGILIDDMPADQFDHVFLRASVGDGWIYLDAADSHSVFHSPPSWCQGRQALASQDPPGIIDIPVVEPSAIQLELRESLNRFRDGRVAGHFEVIAVGQIARLADNRWKSASLAMDNRLQAGQEALSQYLPHSVLEGYERTGGTGTSDRFHVEGTHSRGPLADLPSESRKVISMSWDVPTLPLGYWRTLCLDRLFITHHPMTITVTVRLEGEVRRTMDDISRVPEVDNAFVTISEDVTEKEDAIEIHRTIIVKHKVVRGDDLALVPPGLEQIERALQMVTVYRSTPDPGSNYR